MTHITMVFAALTLLVGAIPQPLPLAMFSHLSGHCWAARISADTLDRHCFRAIYNGAHISDEHVVTQNGEPVYSGQTIYSVERTTLTFTYFNSLGGVGRGFVTRDPEGARFHLQMRATPDAEIKTTEASWRFTGNGYDVVSSSVTHHFRLDDH